MHKLFQFLVKVSVGLNCIDSLKCWIGDISEAPNRWYINIVINDYGPSDYIECRLPSRSDFSTCIGLTALPLEPTGSWPVPNKGSKNKPKPYSKAVFNVLSMSGSSSLSGLYQLPFRITPSWPEKHTVS